MRAIVNILAILFVAAACLLTWQFYATSRSNREAARMDAVFEQLSQRLDAHRQEAGQYPDSLAALYATNLAEAQKITYQRTVWGYTLSYTGYAGYHKSYEVSDKTQSH